MAAISYLGILCLVPLLGVKDDAFVQHHAKQGTAILIVWIILWFGNIIPILGQIVFMLGSLFLLVLVILGIVNALKGEKWEAPLIGPYAKKINV